MASILIQHKVVDFASWKKVFDSNAGLRTSFGEISVLVFRDSNDPNELTVINKWDSLANAQKFAQSPDLKAAMEKAGVIGNPKIFFLNEV